MRRRQFGGVIAASMVPVSYAAAPRKPQRNTLMHVGGDYHSVAGGRITSRENFEYNLRHGVKHLTAQITSGQRGAGWDPDQLKRMQDECHDAGVTFEAIRMDARYITLPKGAERDREL